MVTFQGQPLTQWIGLARDPYNIQYPGREGGVTGQSSLWFVVCADLWWPSLLRGTGWIWRKGGGPTHEAYR